MKDEANVNDAQPKWNLPSLTVLREEPLESLAIDPICGMSVDPRTAISCERDGKLWYFCCEHCRVKFLHPAAETTNVPLGTSYFCPMCPEITSDHPASCPTCGMALEPDLSTTSVSDMDAGQRDLWHRFLVALSCSIPLLIVAMGPMVGLQLDRVISERTSAFLQLLLAIPVVGWCGWPFWVVGFHSFVTRHWNMFTLILLGVGASFGFSAWVLLFSGFTHAHHLYFESAAVITTLVLLGQILEGTARRQTGQAIRELMELVPPTAHLVLDGVETDVSLKDVMTGSLLRVRPGERVPVDGVVLPESPSINDLRQPSSKESAPLKKTVSEAGPSKIGDSDAALIRLTTVDESMLTGESMPVSKGPGDTVFGGTVNQTGSFLMRAERVGRTTMLSQIVDLVAKAQRSRAPAQRLADRVSGWFVPVVILVAAGSFLVWLVAGPSLQWNQAFTHGVAVLIIACPCALGLATPMAITVGMGRGAREGILFRDAESLEQLGHIDTLFLDKTGTLTEGQPSVTLVRPVEGVTVNDVLADAAAVEQYSEHPLARAVIKAARAAGVIWQPVTDFRAIPGLGATGRCGDRELLVGITANAPHTDSSVRSSNMSASVSVNGRLRGEIEFADSIRESARQGLQDLNSLDVLSRILTGDHPAVAIRVAAELGIKETETFAGLKPSEKLSIIHFAQEQGHCVAMAGDGINDAPALSAADVGLSLGSGTDIAKQAAGVILVQPDLRQVAKAIRLSRLVIANIHQNLLFAFGYNLIGSPIAAGILYPFWGITLNPLFAAMAMSLSSVSVIANALRLRQASLSS